ncbi:MAG: hypothetical protein M3R13_10630 [Armatimonadota bacterium]|nr:hypothetical protein [Armatimonadota bacterium]
MSDSIYVVNPETRQTTTVSATTFADLNVKERQDLQAWLINKPDVLGEELLFITSEFDQFDKSGRRLDMLLLDRLATLVVAELKLDAVGTLADQQVVRYGAFCSTMTMEEVVLFYGRTTGKTPEEATHDICEFLREDELPELKGEPRLLLAAGSFDDQELTATVIWLRKFGIDISCIELTPYRYPGDDTNIILVPKTIIPLSEAKDYQIRVERKQRSEMARSARSEFTVFFAHVLSEYARNNPELKGPTNPANQNYMPLHIGHGQIHYEWVVRKREKFVGVCLHFEGPDRDVNIRRLEQVLADCPDLTTNLDHEMIQGPWGKKWAQLTFRIPYSGDMPSESEARLASTLMIEFVRRTRGAVARLG